ncbi:hypothetical protein KBD71_01040 [Candidatus Woesebacteria bacterium]|nr:hypothetical protein [Candidatus Woesebacteria bacterium]
MKIDRLFGFGFRKKREGKDVDARDNDNLAYFFTFQNVKYRVQSFYNPNMQRTTLLTLPDGQIYLAEWSVSIIPPALNKIQSIPPGMDISGLPTITATFDKKSPVDHIHVRLE